MPPGRQEWFMAHALSTKGLYSEHLESWQEGEDKFSPI